MVCEVYIPALRTCCMAKFFLKSIQVSMLLTSCALAFITLQLPSLAVLQVSLVTAQSQKEMLCLEMHLLCYPVVTITLADLSQST